MHLGDDGACHLVRLALGDKLHVRTFDLTLECLASLYISAPENIFLRIAHSLITFLSARCGRVAVAFGFAG